MNARLLRFTLGPGKRAVAQSVADDISPLIAAMPGCKGVTVFGDDSDGQYGIFVLWESEAAANAAAPLIRRRSTSASRGTSRASREARLFEVLSK